MRPPRVRSHPGVGKSASGPWSAGCDLSAGADAGRGPNLGCFVYHIEFPIFHIYGTSEIIAFVKKDSVRTTVDIPSPLYRKLKEQAAASRRSVRELVLAGVRSVLLQGQRPRPKRVQFPLIVSDGPKVDLTNKQIYEHVEFP